MLQQGAVNPDTLLDWLSEANDLANSSNITDLGNSLAHWRLRATLRPRLIQELSVERVELRFIYDARPLNRRCKRVPFTMNTVGTVTQIGWQGCFQGSLDDKSGHQHVVLHPQSWALFGFAWRGTDYVWTTLPFG